jgi:hypothetical protein
MVVEYAYQGSLKSVLATFQLVVVDEDQPKITSAVQKIEIDVFFEEQQSRIDTQLTKQIYDFGPGTEMSPQYIHQWDRCVDLVGRSRYAEKPAPL